MDKSDIINCLVLEFALRFFEFGVIVIELVLACEYNVVLVEKGLGDGMIDIVVRENFVIRGYDVGTGFIDGEDTIRRRWVDEEGNYLLLMECIGSDKICFRIKVVVSIAESSDVLFVGKDNRWGEDSSEHLLIIIYRKVEDYNS